jgi:hypothetical protein
MKKAAPSPMPQSVLRPEVAERYTVAEGTQPVFACAEFGRVDLSQVDLQFAAQLEEKGYLKKLNQADS